MKVKDLDLELSIKLGDPVKDNGDGELFSYASRLSYLKSAYIRLLRMLNVLMDNYSPDFIKSYKYISKELSGEEAKGRKIKLVEEENFIIASNISEMYVKVDDKNINVKYKNPSEYLRLKYNDNTTYSPSIEKENVYYTVIDNAIYLLPEFETEMYESIEVVYKNIKANFNSYDDEIELSEDYKDLLLEIAANFGMMDLGRNDKFQIYTSDINNQLGLVGSYIKVLQSKEGTSVNDR